MKTDVLIDFPVLTTERFTLRPVTSDDINEIFELLSHPDVNKYYGRPRAKSMEAAGRYIETIARTVNNNELLYWGICFKGEPKIVGTICLWNFRRAESRVEIGFDLLPAFQGKGLMKETTKAVIDFAFSVLECEKIDCWPNVENVPSIKLLEKNGFKRDIEAERNIDWNLQPDFYRKNQEANIVTTLIYTVTKTDRYAQS